MSNVKIGNGARKTLNIRSSLVTQSLIDITTTLLTENGTDFILLNKFTQNALEFAQVQKRVGLAPTVSLISGLENDHCLNKLIIK